MGDGNGHTGDGLDDDWVDIEISGADVDSAFAAIDTPLPSDSTRLPAQRPPTPPSLTPVPASLLRAHMPAPRSLSMVCPTCEGPVDVKSRHVAVSGGAVRVYCSQTCLEQRDAPRTDATTGSLDVLPKRSHRIWWVAATLVVGAGCATALYLRRELRDWPEPAVMPPEPAASVMNPVAEPMPSVTRDPQKDADAALTAELMHDRWIHPLAGPARRMPVNHNGAFGAERAGERPPECVSGHCGVDVGRVWGEPVYAVHDGVIDWVNRGPNDEHGGVFVKIAHREGTLFSWYFHLAAVPRWVRPGVKVSAGQMIGLLGDTGIKHSAPHLHFSLSVKTGKHSERYLDPEPLIAIWPLWLPNEGRTGGTLLTDQQPGVPVRATGKRKPRDKAPAAPAAAAAAVDVPAAAAAAPSR